MSVSEIIIKVIGVIMALAGASLLLSVIGIKFLGASLSAPWWVTVLVGLVFLGFGIYIVRGGSIKF